LSIRRKTAVFISGRGSNMTALIEAAKAADYPAEIKLVISNRPEAKGLETAKAEGITAIAIDHTDFDSREAFEDQLQETLLANDIELIALAGFMRKLTSSFTQKWQGRMINIHPSLLPKYKGLNTYQRAIDAGDSEHGATVHYVTGELDSGPHIVQAAVPIKAGDNADRLAARVLVQEHRIYPIALAKAANAL
jgi:phosphoribosylglycinamide formyltransferase-1